MVAISRSPETPSGNDRSDSGFEGSENWGELGYSPRQRHDYTKLQNAARRDAVEQERKKRPNYHRPRPPELSSPPLRNEDGTVILMGPEELAEYRQEANDPKPRPHNPVGPAAVARHILREGGRPRAPERSDTIQ